MAGRRHGWETAWLGDGMAGRQRRTRCPVGGTHLKTSAAFRRLKTSAACREERSPARSSRRWCRCHQWQHGWMDGFMWRCPHLLDCLAHTCGFWVPWRSFSHSIGKRKVSTMSHTPLALFSFPLLPSPSSAPFLPAGLLRLLGWSCVRCLPRRAGQRVSHPSQPPHPPQDWHQHESFMTKHDPQLREATLWDHSLPWLPLPSPFPHLPSPAQR